MKNWMMTVLLSVGCCATAFAQEDRFNVLFIAVDDLRPELACYGHPTVTSPNIDRLAEHGILFERAYCQQAVCNPSRASLMTGLRPETLGVTDLPTHFRDQKPDAVTVAQYFKQHGYHTQGIGKILHTGHGNRDDVFSWSVQQDFKKAPRYGPQGTKHLADLLSQAKADGIDVNDNQTRPRGLPWEAPDIADRELTDGSVAEEGIRLMRKHRDEPFFLAVGFVNPHLPFVAPKKYWDLYDPAEVELASNPNPPQDAPGYAATTWGELRQYYGIPEKGPLPDEQAREAIHGYWAATSYIDALVGQLLDELERLDLRRKTVVILWGDHGWQLGEHGFWCKHTNYEVATRVPLILSVPGQANRGAKSARLVEYVDIFPTLADVCGLPEPQGLDGISFAPLMESPDRPWKNAVFHLYPRSIPGHGPAMGMAIRTERHRLVQWTASGDGFQEYELYDLQSDPEENFNIANQLSTRAVVADLASRLQAGWKSALPK